MKLVLLGICWVVICLGLLLGQQVVFAWTSFGGSSSLTPLQSSFIFLIGFPSFTLGLSHDFFWVGLLVNSLFWLLVVYLIVKSVRRFNLV